MHGLWSFSLQYRRSSLPKYRTNFDLHADGCFDIIVSHMLNIIALLFINRYPRELAVDLQMLQAAGDRIAAAIEAADKEHGLDTYE